MGFFNKTRKEFREYWMAELLMRTLLIDRGFLAFDQALSQCMNPPELSN